MDLLMDHVDEALEMGFDDSSTKFKGKNHFVVRKNALYFLKRKIILFSLFFYRYSQLKSGTTLSKCCIKFSSKIRIIRNSRLTI